MSYNSSILNKLRILLIPISIVYFFIIHLRRILYDKVVLKKFKSKVKIISVGNINTGGSGKSPLVNYIAKYFLSKNLKIGILSRGYGRKNKNLQLAFKDGILGTTDKCGDELIMISQNLIKNNFINFIAVADENKINGIKFLENNKVDLILLDDGFQSDYLFKDSDIVILDADEEFSSSIQNQLLLPAGNLRVPKSFLKNASVIIQNNKTKDFGLLNNKYVLVNYEIKGIYNFQDEIIDNGNHNFLAISGIAKPFSFLNSLKKAGINQIKFINFKDHYNYNLSELNSIIETNKFDYIITTEKDMVKINNIVKDDILKLFTYLKIDVKVLINEDILLNHLNKFVNI